MRHNAHIRSEHTIVVHQMGKVGSSTVYASLSAAVRNTPVYKTHYLSEQGISRGRALYRDLPRQVAVPHDAESAELARRIRTEPDTRWKVVTLVREPIARDVSAYIQMVDVLHPQLVGGAAVQVDRIARASGAQFIAFDERTSYTCGWFDVEILPVFGVDVYATPFDHARGYTVLRKGNVELLVLRLEDLNAVCSPALSEFTGQDVPMVRHSSRSPEKLQEAYTEQVYRRILRKISVPARCVERIYASRYARHFYTAAELDRFARRWSRQAAA